MVYADQMSGSQNYSLSGQAWELLLDRVSPDHMGNQGPSTITLTGDGFDDATTVELIAPDNTIISSTARNVVSATQMTADFDLTSIGRRRV